MQYGEHNIDMVGLSVAVLQEVPVPAAPRGGGEGGGEAGAGGPRVPNRRAIRGNSPYEL